VIGAPSPYPVYVDVVVADQNRLEYAGRRVDRGVDVGPVAVGDQRDRGTRGRHEPDPMCSAESRTPPPPEPGDGGVLR